MINKIRQNTLFIMILFLLFATSTPKTGFSRSQSLNDKLLKQTHQIVEKYYHGPQITREQLMEGAATGMVDMLNNLEVELKKSTLKVGSYSDTELKDHTFNQLLKPSNYKLIKESIAGKFAGIGAIIKKDSTDTTITLTRLLDGSSALEAGMEDNDEITAIDNKPVEKLSLKECVMKLRGVTGTKLQLKVKRAVEEKSVDLKFTVTRRPVSIPDVESKIYDNNCGYILIRSFSDSTSILLARALTKIKKAGIDKLILDLRDNPGGEFTSAIKVSDLFLPKDAPIVSTSQKDKTRSWNSKRGQFWRGALVCLINDRTASAAEIVAGAIKSSSTGIVAGQPTFGKDSVQTVFRMTNGYGLKLTTSRLILRGRNKNESRIQPDVFLEKRESDSIITSYKPAKKDESKNSMGINLNSITDDAIKSACGILNHMRRN